MREGANVEKAGVHAGISCLIYSHNLKPGFGRSRRLKSRAFKQAFRAGVFHEEHPGILVPLGPLSPYLDFVCIPETSGGEMAPSEHLDFRPDLDLLPLL